MCIGRLYVDNIHDPIDIRVSAVGIVANLQLLTHSGLCAMYETMM